MDNIEKDSEFTDTEYELARSVATQFVSGPVPGRIRAAARICHRVIAGVTKELRAENERLRGLLCEMVGEEGMKQDHDGER